jgi:hypothetical protein
MFSADSPGVVGVVTRGAVAGLLGGVVMTAFQRLVEMPLTGREESYAPAVLVEKLLPIQPEGAKRRRINHVAHFAVGVTWGVGHALMVRRTGLRGQLAVGTVFAAVWGGDVVANTALGLTKPWEWSAQDLAIDVVDKLVLAEATGLLYDRLDPTA